VLSVLSVARSGNRPTTHWLAESIRGCEYRSINGDRDPSEISAALGGEAGATTAPPGGALAMRRGVSVTGAVLFSVAAIHAASDWPQWQGPDRTRVSKETGLLKEWPAGGPRVVWTSTGRGSGYGSMAIAADRVFVQSTRGSNSVTSIPARSTALTTTRRRVSMLRRPRSRGSGRWRISKASPLI
jgi:hypothetical protein